MSHQLREKQKLLWRVLLLGQLLFLSFTSLHAQSLEEKMEKAGLVDVHTEFPSIVVQLMYATEDNFVGENMYGDELASAYLLPRIVRKLGRAQELLRREKGAQYSIIIFDAARPLSVQKRMFAAVRGTPNTMYVSSGRNGGGRHNYGAAVDLSIVNVETGELVDMGAGVDHFGSESHMEAPASMIGEVGYANRQYLFDLMRRVGLRPIRKEWWHFQEYESIHEVRRKYQLLDF